MMVILKSWFLNALIYGLVTASILNWDYLEGFALIMGGFAVVAFALIAALVSFSMNYVDIDGVSEEARSGLYMKVTDWRWPFRIWPARLMMVGLVLGSWSTGDLGWALYGVFIAVTSVLVEMGYARFRAYYEEGRT